MQRNPFFEELIAEESQRSPPFAPCSSSGSSPFHYTTLPPQPYTPSPAHNVNATNMASIKRERPRPVARQISLPALLPKAAAPNSNHAAPRSMSESAGEWDDFFDAFASSRLNSPKGSLPQKQLKTSAPSSHGHSYPVNNNGSNHAQQLQTCEEQPPPLPPRRLLRTSVNEIFSDGWLHRGQELAVHKEAYLLSQTGVASLQRGKEGESKRNSISPDPHTSSEISDSLSVKSQPCPNVTSPGVISEENLRKFKYEPLEDDTDCWGGMLFEQDLYGRMFRGNYGQPRVNSHQLSLKSEETTGNNITLKNSGPKKCLDSEMSVTDLLNMANITSPNPDIRVLDTICGPVEEEGDPDPIETCINNNVSFSLTLGDLNMNVNHLDFSFIDSDGSSQSEVVDTLKGINSLGGTLPPPKEDSLTSVYHEDTTPEDMFTLRDTYISDMDSSFAVTASSNSLCKSPSACQDNCQECRCEQNNVAPHGHSRTNSREVTELLPQSQTSNSPDLETGSRGDKTTGDNDLKKTQKDFDDNGNPDAKIASLKQTQVFPGVVSARFRPKGVSRQNSSGSPNSQSKSEDKEFEQLLSLVQNISLVREGPLSYQPTKSALSSLLALDKQTDLQVDGTNTTPQRSSKENTTSLLPENCATDKASEISFEDLHAKVAPNSRSPSKSKIGQSLQEPEPSSPSTPSALSLSADAQAELHPTPVCCPSIHPSSMGPSAGASTTLAVAPYTSSYSTTSTTDQPLVDARHSLLPEETQPANNLPHQESR